MPHVFNYSEFQYDVIPSIRWDSYMQSNGELSEKLHVTYTFHGNMERMLPAGVTKDDVERLLNQAFPLMIDSHRSAGPTKFLIRDRHNKYAVRGVFQGNANTYSASNDMTLRGDNKIGRSFNKSIRKESYVSGLRPDKGYGFVKSQNLKDDNLFFHKGAMHVTSFDELRDRDVVEYQKGRDQRTGGDAAIKVSLMDDKKTVVVGELLSFDQYSKIINTTFDERYDSKHLTYLQNRLSSIKEPVKPGDWVYDVITVNAKTLYHPNTPTDIVIDIEEEGPVLRYINGKWK